MIVMPPVEMTLDDLMLLEQFRIERLCSFFAQSLPKCIVYVDPHDTLTIHCPEPWIVDTLLIELEDLCGHAWLILGVEAIALFFAQEKVFHIGYCRDHIA